MFVGLFFIVASLVVGALINYLATKKEKVTEPDRKRFVSSKSVKTAVRLAFPIAYLVFNIAYWVTYLNK